MTETTRERRDELRLQCDTGSGTHKPVSYWELRWLLNDADRLAAIERGIKSMIEDYEFYNDEGMRARDTAKHLRAIPDSEVRRIFVAGALVALFLLALALGSAAGYQEGLRDGEQRMRAEAVEQGYGCYYLRFDDEGEPVWVFRLGKYNDFKCEREISDG